MGQLLVGILRSQRAGGWTWRRALSAGLTFVAGAIALTFPDDAMAAIQFAAGSMIAVAPVILVGALVAGIASASGAVALIAGAFEGRQARMIIVASLVGALLPICGITVLPLVAGLLAARVPLAPIMAFWLSSPITSPSMLVITAGTLGWPFALAKTLAAVGVGLLGGFVTFLLYRLGWFQQPARQSGAMARLQSTCGAGSSDRPFIWKFWRETERRRVLMSTMIETGRLMLIWLAIAFLAEYVLRQHAPADLLSETVGEKGPWAIPLAAIIGAPLYLDGYAALPLVRGLIDAGMRPDAALALLVAGGITSAWAVIPVLGLVRRSVFALYLVLAFTSAMAAGWVFGLFL